MKQYVYLALIGSTAATLCETNESCTGSNEKCAYKDVSALALPDGTGDETFGPDGAVIASMGWVGFANEYNINPTGPTQQEWDETFVDYYRYSYQCIPEASCGVAESNVTWTCLELGETAAQKPNPGVPCGTDAECFGGTKCGYLDFMGAAPPTSDSDSHYQWYVDLGLVEEAARVNLTPTTMHQCAMDQWAYTSQVLPKCQALACDDTDGPATFKCPPHNIPYNTDNCTMAQMSAMNAGAGDGGGNGGNGGGNEPAAGSVPKDEACTASSQCQAGLNCRRIDLRATTAPTSNDDPLMNDVYKNLFIDQTAANEQWGGNGDILAATPAQWNDYTSFIYSFELCGDEACDFSLGDAKIECVDGGNSGGNGGAGGGNGGAGGGNEDTASSADALIATALSAISLAALV